MKMKMKMARRMMMMMGMGMKDVMKGERVLIRHLMQSLHICSDNRAQISRQSS